jgi:cell fate regulator YaaT (PSP1 superfamily)
MAQVVGVRFEPIGRVHYFDPSDFDLNMGDIVTVETDEGPRDGRVVIAPNQVAHSDLRGPMEPVVALVKPK